MWLILFCISLVILISHYRSANRSSTSLLETTSLLLPELWIVILLSGSVAVNIADFFGGLHNAVALFVGSLCYPLFLFSKPLATNRLIVESPETKTERTVKAVVAIFIGLTLVITFAAGLLLPPNNWDSMTYHLSRVMYWDQHDSLVFYPTHNVRQLYQPPLAEWIAYLGYKLDLETDRGLFLIQWLSYLGCLSLSWQVVSKLDTKAVYKWLALGFGSSIPMAVLQASSTQNDQVLAFLVLYVAVRLFSAATILDFVRIGIVASLAIMTKGTAFFMLSGPAIIFLLTRYRVLKVKLIAAGATGIALGLLVYLPQIIQNQQHIGHPLGIDKAEAAIYSNEQYYPNLLLNNLMRNVGMHLSVPGMVELSTKAQTVVIETLTQTSVNDTRISFPDLKYEAPYATQEDYATNLIALAFILFSLQFVFKEVKSILTHQLVLSGLVSMVVFACLVKWQVWHSRLHLPIFWMATSSAVIVVLNRRQPAKIWVLGLLALLSGLGIFFGLKNDRRQLGNPKHWVATGWDSYYAADRDDQLNDWHQIKSLLEKENVTSVGLYLNGDQWDYPICKWMNDQGIDFQAAYPPMAQEQMNWKLKPASLYESTANIRTAPDIYLVDLSTIKDRNLLKTSALYLGSHFALIKPNRHSQK